MNVLPSRAVVSEEEFAVAPPVLSVNVDEDDAFETVDLTDEPVSEIDDDDTPDFDDVPEESMSDDEEGFVSGEVNRFESERFVAAQRADHEYLEPPNGFWFFGESRDGLRSNDGEVSTSAKADKPKGV